MTSYEEFKSVMEGRPGFVIAGWCGSADCEAQIKAETPELRQSRLLLCDLTARTIRKGLELLGIRVVEKITIGEISD